LDLQTSAQAGNGKQLYRLDKSMTDWANWDTMLLEYQGDPLTRENKAVVDAFQAVEGHGGDYNPFNVGPGPFHGVDLSKAPFLGTPSPYPPTLDFPGPSAGVAASEVVGESNWPDLLKALQTGHPLSLNWIISQGAATPADQYTAEVRSLASQYLAGTATYSLGDTSLNKQEPGSGGITIPSGTGTGGTGSGGCPPADHPKNTLSTCDGCHDPGANTGASGFKCDCYPWESWQQCKDAGRLIPGVIGGVTGAISSVGDFLSLITSAAFWIRAGEIVGGILLLWLGLSRIVKGLPGPGAVAKGAAGSAAGLARA
jgi:hypothetical protein